MTNRPAATTFPDARGLNSHLTYIGKMTVVRVRVRIRVRVALGLGLGYGVSVS